MKPFRRLPNPAGRTGRSTDPAGRGFRAVHRSRSPGPVYRVAVRERRSPPLHRRDSASRPATSKPLLFEQRSLQRSRERFLPFNPSPVQYPMRRETKARRRIGRTSGSRRPQPGHGIGSCNECRGGKIHLDHPDLRLQCSHYREAPFAISMMGLVWRGEGEGKAGSRA